MASKSDYGFTNVQRPLLEKSFNNNDSAGDESHSDEERDEDLSGIDVVN